MDIHNLIGGFILGFLVALPIGPVSLTCIRNSVTEGPMTGVLTGLGAAFGHGLFALAAGTGAVVIAAFMDEWRPALTLFSAMFLIGLGLSRLLRTWRGGAPAQTKRRPGLQCVNGLMLAISNPLTVLPYLAFAASIGNATTPTASVGTIPLAMGASLGAGAWYMSVTTLAALVGRKIGGTLTGQMDAISGLVLICFGCLLLVHPM